MAAHNDIGKLGEDLAVKFLEEEGFVIYDRNYNYLNTEVDIVAMIENELHFVEVKTRSNTQFNHPEEAVDEKKRMNIQKAAKFYLLERQFVTIPAVFDVIAVALDNPDKPEITHFEDAWRPKNSY